MVKLYTILESLTKEVFLFEVKIQRWLLIILCSSLLIGYLDFVTFKGASIKHYTLASIFEVVLVVAGYTLGRSVTKNEN